MFLVLAYRKLRDIYKYDPHKREVLGRISVVMLLVYSLAVASLPNAVPTQMSSTIGIFGAGLALAVPTFAFSIVAVFPGLLVSIFTGVVGCTILLAASIVGDGCMVGVYTAYVFVATTLHYGPHYAQTGGQASTWIVIAALFSLSYKEVVREFGFQFISAMWTTTGLSNNTAVVSNMFIALGWIIFAVTMGIMIIPCRVRTSRTFITRIVIPAALKSTSRICRDPYLLRDTVAPQDDHASGDVGDEVEPADQVEDGVADRADNIQEGGGEGQQPFDYDSFVHLVSVVSDPSKSMTLIFEPRLFIDPTEYIVPDLQRLMERAKDIIVRALVIASNQMRDIDFLQTHSMQHHVRRHLTTEQLQQATPVVQRNVAHRKVVLGNIGILMDSVAGVLAQPHTKFTTLDDLLMNNTNEATTSVVQPSSTRGRRAAVITNPLIITDPNKEQMVEEDQEIVWFDRMLERVSRRFVQAAIHWLQVLHFPKQHPSANDNDKTASSTKSNEKTAWLENVKKMYLPWIVGPMLGYFRVCYWFTLVFQPKRWDWRVMAWSAEYTAGSVVLYAATVFSEEYRSFAISIGPTPTTISFAGWNIGAYTFCWQPTVEGTIKKGVERLIGTVVGGFFGWLGIIVCAWSYDDSAPVSPYGLVAWLTVVSVLIAALFALPSGTAARFGQDYDHGTTAAYCITTMATVALDVYFGAGTKHNVAANRIVANTSGIAMAMLISLVPPHPRGGDPKHTIRYWTELDTAFCRLLELLSADRTQDRYVDIASKQFRSTFLAEAAAARTRALFLWKDAARLRTFWRGRCCTWLNVSPEIKLRIEQMSILESYLDVLLALTINVFENADTIEGESGGIDEQLRQNGAKIAADVLAQHREQINQMSRTNVAKDQESGGGQDEEKQQEDIFPQELWSFWTSWSAKQHHQQLHANGLDEPNDDNMARLISLTAHIRYLLVKLKRDVDRLE